MFFCFFLSKNVVSTLFMFYVQTGPVLRDVDDEDVDDPDEADEDVEEVAADDSEDEDYKVPESGIILFY